MKSSVDPAQPSPAQVLNRHRGHSAAVRLVLLVAAAIAFTADAQPKGATDTVPLLVELFTSEGCSSCPPADALLDRMLVQQPIAGALLVGLGEHVDYWDDSGWSDRFSSPRFTLRQQHYASRTRGDEVYTPQMVIDGGDGFVGSDLSALRRAVERAAALPHGDIRVSLDPRAADTTTIAVAVEIRSLPAAAAEDQPDLLIAITEDGLRTDVRRGENQGRALTHIAVVRDLVTVGPAVVSTVPVRKTIRLQTGWRREALKVVAFVQQRRSLHVVATAVHPLERQAGL